MSLEMNTIAMPTTQRDPVQVNILCFEASSANLATVRALKAAATSNDVVTAEALQLSGMKAFTFASKMSTKMSEVRADVEHCVSTVLSTNDLHLSLFAMSRNTGSAANISDPLVSLVDGLTVEEVMGCPQISAQPGSVPKDEVRVGGFDEGMNESSSSSSLPSVTSPTLVLFYSRDTVLGCSDCCLCACLGAMCATLLCCCCCAN